MSDGFDDGCFLADLMVAEGLGGGVPELTQAPSVS